MPRTFFTITRHLFFFCVLSVLRPIPVSSAPMWTAEIEEALAARDEFCRRVGIESGRSIHDFSSPREWERLGSRLVVTREADNPWQSLLSGMALARSLPADSRASSARQYASAYFTKAISLSRDRPGDLWVLFVEFSEMGEYAWAQTCLEELEKAFIARGGQSAQVVAQTAMYYARRAAREKHYESAAKMLDWAAVFDRNLGWAPARKAILRFPLSPRNLVDGLRDLAATVRESWVLQVSILSRAFEFAVQCLSLLTVALIGALGVKYLSRAVHPVAHAYSPVIPLRLRVGYAMFLFLAVFSFGVIPILWLTLHLTWRFLTKPERIVAGVCAGLLACAPLATRAVDMFRQPLTPGSSPYLFSRSLDQVASPDLERQVTLHVEKHADDYLANLAAAVVAMKKGDHLNATLLVRRAESIRPNDPVVLLTAANIAHHSDDFATANAYFKKCMDMFPALEASFFNPCLYYFGEMKFMEGIQLVENASKLNPERISSFLHKNDKYFGAKWPRLRYFLQADYKPSSFFSDIFPQYCGTWRTADRLWGNAFLGIPLLPSLVVSLLLLGGLLVRRVPRADSLYSCKLCGIPTCRNCRKGDVCPDCYATVTELRNHPLGQQVRTRIALRRRRIAAVLRAVLDVVYPGAGGVAGAEEAGALIGAVAVALLTSVVYAVQLSFLFATFSYPFWVVGDAARWLCLALLAYNVFFLVRRGRALVGTLTKG